MTPATKAVFVAVDLNERFGNSSQAYMLLDIGKIRFGYSGLLARERKPSSRGTIRRICFREAVRVTGQTPIMGHIKRATVHQVSIIVVPDR